MDDDVRLEEIVRLELELLGVDDGQDHFCTLLDGIQRIEHEIDAVIEHIHSGTLSEGRTPPSGASLQCTEPPTLAYDSVDSVASRRSRSSDRRRLVVEEESLESRAARLGDEADQQQAMIEQCERYVGHLETTYGLKTWVARKVARAVFKNGGRILKSAATMAGSSLSVAGGNLLAVTEIVSNAVELAVIARDIYKEVKEWKANRRLGKRDRHLTLAQLDKMKLRLEEIKKQLNDDPSCPPVAPDNSATQSKDLFSDSTLV